LKNTKIDEPKAPVDTVGLLQRRRDILTARSDRINQKLEKYQKLFNLAVPK
jgi:hypothetical protein